MLDCKSGSRDNFLALAAAVRLEIHNYNPNPFFFPDRKRVPMFPAKEAVRRLSPQQIPHAIQHGKTIILTQIT